MAATALVWRAGELLFAVRAAAVTEILPPVPSRPVTGTAPWILGVFAHRGVAAALVDTPRLLGLAPEEAAPVAADQSGSAAAAVDGGGNASASRPVRLGNRVIVTPMPPPHAERRLGLWVDAVLDLCEVEEASPESHPGFPTVHGRLLGRLVGTPWGPAQLVEPEGLFDADQWAALAGRLDEATS